MTYFSEYDNKASVEKRVKEGYHRGIIGDLWEELGALQLEFLKAKGLRPWHKFIDVGAGSFRAGVKLIPYLSPGHYFAIDSNVSLLEAGYAKEVEALDLSSSFPRANFNVNREFDVSSFGCRFDYGIAQSVFSHMPISMLGNCLSALAPKFRRRAVFYVTVFLVDEKDLYKSVQHSPGGVISFCDKDPYHTTVKSLQEIADQTNDWSMEIIGDWGHPRDQKMISFVRTA